MRRVVLTGMVLAALASGCGGGSDGTRVRPDVNSGSQGPAATATPQASDGQLGGAVVARPGNLSLHGKVEKITGRSILPPSQKHALGAEDNCTNVEVQPTPDNLQTVSDAVFCLMNAMRANAGVPALRQQAQLASASVEHSQDMVSKKYFAHDSQDGRTLVDRLKTATYIPKSGDWVVGENLAWGAGALSTPKALVNAWMNSPPHRENLLSGDFVEVGMGLVFGTPSDKASDGVTVTTDFGTRPGSAAAGAAATDTTGATDVADGGDDSVTAPSTSGAGVLGTAAAAKKRAARAKHRKALRRKALRRCAKKHGRAKRRCVKRARRIR